jgi:hypothetical protein
MTSEQEDVWARLAALSAADDDEALTTTAADGGDTDQSSMHSAAVSLWRDLAAALSADPGS